jgi:hypothetical protein
MILNGDIKNGELTGTLLKKYQHKKNTKPVV